MGVRGWLRKPKNRAKIKRGLRRTGKGLHKTGKGLQKAGRRLDKWYQEQQKKKAPSLEIPDISMPGLTGPSGPQRAPRTRKKKVQVTVYV